MLIVGDAGRNGLPPPAAARMSRQPFSFLALAQVLTAVWLGIVFMTKIATLHFSPMIDYQVGEWLVNYSQGFIRRGLAGEIALRIAAAAGADAVVLLKLVGGLSVAVFLWIFVRRVLAAPGLSRNERFGLLFMPAGAAFILVNPQAILRKDYVALLAFLAFFSVIERPGKPNLLRAGLALAAAGSVAILIHEVFLLLCIPYVVLLLWARLAPTTGYGLKTAARIAAVIAVPVLAAIPVLTIQPPAGTAARICEAAQPYAPHLECAPLPDAMTFLDMGQESAFSISYRRLVLTRLWGLPQFLWWLLAYLPLAWLHYELLWRMLLAHHEPEARHRAQTAAFGLTLFNVALVCAMSAVGFDVGRWIFMVTSMATVCAGSAVSARSLVGWFSRLPLPAPLAAPPAMQQRLYITSILAAGFLSTQFRLPHTCASRLLDLLWFIGDIHDYIHASPPETALAWLACLGDACR